jgi:zinc/manganese transport system substrate-binding protein
MRRGLNLATGGALALAFVTVAACDGGDGSAEADRPMVVVTTTILGEVVAEVVGDVADVEVVMPIGADPHEFAPSARQAEAMADADLLVVNGGGFEAGMTDVVEQAASDGAPLFDASAHADVVDGDPHLWMDPLRMVAVTEALAEQLAELDGIDAEAVRANADAYVQQLTTLDAEIADLLAPIPADRRVLVTNHDVLGYFAERYDLQIVGAVIPSLTTAAQPSAADLEQLAVTVEEAGVRTIFGETTQPVELADALAEEVGGDVAVVELFTESLGEPGSGADTYVGMLRTDAELITAGLA